MRAPGIVAFALCFLSRVAFAGDAPWDVALRSSEVFQGGIAEIRVSGEDVRTLKGYFRDQEISFFAEQDSFAALFGVDLEEKPGPLRIVIRGWSSSGEKNEKPVVLRVRKKTFPQEKISVPAVFDRIDEAARRRIEREQGRLDRLWAISTPQRLWEGDFLAPVSGGITSPFGLRRVVNGSPRSPHGGVDLKAPLGAEILAANHGRVVLREEFFFSGKSIVLDHGIGLYTMYFHLTDFNVEKDSQVRKGDLIGWAGMTGRVTGPHLHWGVRLNGARVDPFEVLAIK